MKKPYKAPPRFYRDGTRVPDGYRLGACRSFASLKAAIRGVRLDVAELAADGVALPLDIAVRFEHSTRSGRFVGSEVVALWKRGRFVWVDPLARAGVLGATGPAVSASRRVLPQGCGGRG